MESKLEYKVQRLEEICGDIVKNQKRIEELLDRQEHNTNSQQEKTIVLFEKLDKNLTINKLMFENQKEHIKLNAKLNTRVISTLEQDIKDLKVWRNSLTGISVLTLVSVLGKVLGLI